VQSLLIACSDETRLPGVALAASAHMGSLERRTATALSR